MTDVSKKELPAAKLKVNELAKDNDIQTFEGALLKLEEYVRTLEQGDLTLDESLKIFEQGMTLAKYCTKKLDDAENKIEVLLKKDGELIKEDFEVPEGQN